MVHTGGRRTRTRKALRPPDFKSGSLPIRIALRENPNSGSIGPVNSQKATGNSYLSNMFYVGNIEDFHRKARKKLTEKRLPYWLKKCRGGALAPPLINLVFR